MHAEVWKTAWEWYKSSFEDSFAWGKRRKEEAKKNEAQAKMDVLQGMVKDAREATHNSPEVAEENIPVRLFSRLLTRLLTCLVACVSACLRAGLFASFACLLAGLPAYAGLRLGSRAIQYTYLYPNDASYFRKSGVLILKNGNIGYPRK